jgi:type III pantothenate kinase
MLLVCDIGNSNIVFGLYDGDELRASWRLTSRLNATVDEYTVSMGALLARFCEPREIKAAILSSVVPPLTPKIEQVIAEVAGARPLLVGPGIKTGLDIQLEDPREVGADRIVNAVAALTRHAPPLIVADFGTATTLDVVLAPNVYVGGVILPGVIIALDALVTRTAKLPKVELGEMKRVVGHNTVEAIRSGMYWGTGAQVDGLADAISAELGIAPRVIATGGLAQLIAGASRRIEHVEPDLTLWGLRELWLKNR